MDAATHELAPDSAARGTLETAVSYLEGVLVAGRDELMGLRTAIGGRRCLADALDAVGRCLAQGLPASFTLDVQGEQWPMDEQALDHLFAIGREGIANAFRHAGARHIALGLVFAEAGVSMTVRDDGKGFDAGGMAAGSGHGHWGLVNMRERARKLGATLSITSGAGQGTAIRVEWQGPQHAGQEKHDGSVMMPL
jgi:signal transduction histidine kinase